MSATQELDVSVPTDIESARGKLVYLYLATAGTATVDSLHDDLGISKGTALSITGALRERGHLRRTNGRYELAC
ncbi:helix-turn-helix domain-containing protein [Halobacteria archaeon AArc-dxtr1]|nr:helix-turn-helix domain-containing protein [Halobacteria archaeon AArc-dxtr1]